MVVEKGHTNFLEKFTPRVEEWNALFLLYVCEKVLPHPDGFYPFEDSNNLLFSGPCVTA